MFHSGYLVNRAAGKLSDNHSLSCIKYTNIIVAKYHTLQFKCPINRPLDDYGIGRCNFKDKRP